MTDKLSKQLTESRKNHSKQQCFISVMEMQKKISDERGYICAMFIDLSKTFGRINHDLLIAKLGVNGFERDALR